VLLILGGALGSALVAYRSGSRVDVLVARHEINPGQQVSAEDFGTARVASDGGLVVPSAALKSFVGSYATTRIPEGALVTNTMFRAGGVLPDGAQLVGVVVPGTQRIAADIKPGDVVRVFYVVGKTGQAASGVNPGDPIVEAARVVSASKGSGGSDLLSLSVLVPDEVAGRLAQFASASQLAVSKLPDDTRPTVDLKTK
jgi:hypothetical protein